MKPKTLFITAILLAAFSFSPRLLPAEETKRPNVLFIIVDDQSPFDLKIYNERSTLDTPNIDWLAKNGATFDEAYQMGAWVGAVCTCSRHMVMSGRTLWHIPDKRQPSKNNPNTKDPKLVPPELANNTLAAVFNRAGYDTMRTCKNGNSYEAANKQFTVRRDATKRGGTAETGSAWHADQVLDFLNQRERTKDEDPFFIYFGFSHPHDTRDGTPELLEKYGAVNHTDKNTLPELEGKEPKLPINYLPKHPFHHGQPGLRDEVAVKGVWTKRDEATIRNEIGRQYACSENIDIQIGRVLEKLKATGELENTYIVYTSDHGMAIGRHGLQGKQNLYQHTWRVPYIVTGPKIESGIRVKGNIYLLDSLATLCGLTNVTPPETNEGKSAAPVLFGETETVRDVMYGCYCGGTQPGMRCVKKGDWKLVKFDVLDGEVQETQLFNLAENPHEFLQQHRSKQVVSYTGVKPTKDQTNLADDPRFAEKRQEMETLLLSEMKRLHDPHKLWDQ